MSHFRYSTICLFLGVLVVVLAIGTLKAVLRPDSPLDVALGGLSLLTLCFGSMCGIFGKSALRILLLSGVFYAWGWTCLFLEDVVQVGAFPRLILAILGTSFSFWAWLGPIQPAPWDSRAI